MCAGIVPIARSATSPWDGAYVLDRTGNSFEYSKSAGGIWHMTTEDSTFDFKPDGKPSTTKAGVTQTVTKGPAGDLIIVLQFTDKTIETIKESPSADGKTLISVTAGTNGDGSIFSSTQVSERDGAGTGVLAKWTLTRRSGTQAALNALAISTAPDGIVTMTYSSAGNKATLTGRPDGTPLPVTDPQGHSGFTIAFKSVSPRRMDFITAQDGVTQTVGYYQLSGDGKVLDDVYWNPQNPSDKGAKVYLRQ